MLNKIKSLLQNVDRKVPSFDPSIYNDPVAEETEWSPLKGGGSNFRTHKLVEVDHSRFEFKSTLAAKIFSSVFMIVGIGTPILMTNELIERTGHIFHSDFLFALVFGLIFLGVGSLMFYGYLKPLIFDRTKGMFWKGWEKPQKYLGVNSVDEGSRLGDIHALQIIAERIRSEKRYYYSFELNLVFKDGSRMNVVDHGDFFQLRQDAKALSEFLGVPIWNPSDTTSG